VVYEQSFEQTDEIHLTATFKKFKTYW